MSSENIKVDLKNMVSLVNSYIKSKDNNFIQEIEMIFQKSFDVQFAMLWKFNAHDNSLCLFNSEKTEESLFFLNSSLVKQSIDSKNPLICNHTTSDKYYEATIDNPTKLKVKALMIFPILKGNTVVGILKLWRGIKDKKIFTKNDEKLFSIFSFILSSLFDANEINKAKVIEMTQDLSTETPSKRKIITPSVNIRGAKKFEEVKRNTTAFKEDSINWEKKYKDLLVSQKIEEESQHILKVEIESQHKQLSEYENDLKKIDTLNQQLEAEKEKVLEYNVLFNAHEKQKQELLLKIKDHDKVLMECHSKYKELSASSGKLYQKNDRYVTELNSEITALKKDKKFLFEKAKELQTFKEHAEEGNVDELFSRFNSLFFEKELSYAFFSVIIYSLSSPQGLSYLEENLKEIKGLKSIVNSYAFFPVNNIEIDTGNFINFIKDYERTVFLRKFTFKVKVKDNFPATLILDVHKVQNVVLLLLNEFYPLIDTKEAVNIFFYTERNSLKIDIGSSIVQNKSFFSLNSESKILEKIETSPSFLLSKKIISRLKGTVQVGVKNNYYQVSLNIYTKVK